MSCALDERVPPELVSEVQDEVGSGLARMFGVEVDAVNVSVEGLDE